MFRHPVEELKGKEVIVIAEGVIYRGILIEIGEDEVTLSTEARWVSIPHSKITEIYDPAAESQSHRQSYDPQSFWDEKFDPHK